MSLYALKGTAVYFYTPAATAGGPCRCRQDGAAGRLVKPGTVIHAADGSVSFVVQDKLQSVAVSYRGDLPDLFREGQGVVCEGVLVSGDTVRATQVLAKHDEKYIPKNVEEELKKQGEMAARQRHGHIGGGEAVRGIVKMVDSKNPHHHAHEEWARSPSPVNWGGYKI